MINVADVVAEYGAYYLDGGQSIADLTKLLYRPSVTASYFASVPTQKTRWQIAQAELDRVLQPFQKAFTSIGTLTFTPLVIDLFRLKIDKDEYPDDVAESWLAFLEGEGVDRTQWPFIRWFIEQHILPKAAEDFELNEVYAGVYAAPTAGTAGPAGTAMDGIKKIQDDQVTAGRITPYVMGDPDDTLNIADDEAFCTAVESFIGSIPIEYRRRLDNLFMSENYELRYRRGKRKKYNTQYLQEPNLDTLADFPNVIVKGLPSHNGSKRMWTSLPNVRKRPIKKENLKNNLKIEGAKREVSMFTDWYEGVGFTIPEGVFITDQD